MISDPTTGKGEEPSVGSGSLPAVSPVVGSKIALHTKVSEPSAIPYWLRHPTDEELAFHLHLMEKLSRIHEAFGLEPRVDNKQSRTWHK